jgi:hypothetical protein
MSMACDLFNYGQTLMACGVVVSFIWAFAWIVVTKINQKKGV